ncbi:MAG: hypothetical protein LBJ90_03410 [Treponema sp.]|jgi:hypothetical protein|nr:hypothetical protein [Treponema sp.]
MSDSENPYRGPQNPANPGAADSARLTENMLTYLKKAAPWLRFIGILGFIVGAFLALGGIIFIVLIPISSVLLNEIPGLEEYAGIAGILLGLYFIILAALCFFPALYTYKFGAGIRSYLLSGTDQYLETAFKNNKSLWKFLGILAIIGMAFIPFAVIVSIIAGIAAVFA